MLYHGGMPKNVTEKKDNNSKKYKHAIEMPTRKIRKRDLLTRIILLEEKISMMQGSSQTDHINEGA